MDRDTNMLLCDMMQAARQLLRAGGGRPPARALATSRGNCWASWEYAPPCLPFEDLLC